MLRLASRAGFVLVFVLVLVDAGQDLFDRELFFSVVNLAAVGVALAAVLPLALVGLRWRAAQLDAQLSTLLAALYFSLLLVLVGAWLQQVLLGPAAPEGAAQMHLLFFPVFGAGGALLGLLACYVIASIIRRVRRKQAPNHSFKRTPDGAA